MRLRAVYNKRMGQAKLCHDQWCKPGETSVVAIVLTTGDEAADMKLAEQIAERWNMVEDATGK
ncbi:MAG: hypothetical protein DI533_20070 [Cereibacter sphaeroides]|uniref:Uncharacterized protein n=1 Tax=Cereibacter sphaeroides TaxID=1063 RepID=A0A2W5S0H2_CERSP|nr:MAG: hypothetical protein DI533_20070 [Cereibacter sphaeroides]